MAINNTAQNSTIQGLVPSSPFLSSSSNNGVTSGLVNLNQGGSTTKPVGGSTFSLGGNPIAGTYGSSPTSTPVTPNINFGSIGVTPGGSDSAFPSSSVVPSSSSSGINTYGLTASSPNWYQLQPGESTSNYYSRTQGQSASATSTASNPYGAGGTATNNAQSGGLIAAPQPSTVTGLVPAPTGYTPTQENLNPYTSSAPTYSGLVGTLGNTAATSSPQYQAAQAQYNEANQQLEQLQADEAKQNANIGGSRTNLAEAGGEQGLLQNLYAGQATALTNEMNAAQAAAQTATGQQATQQSGLAGAAGLTAPQPANALGTYNPTTGQYSGYGGGTNGLQTAGNAQAQIGIGQNVGQLNSALGGAQVVGQNLQSLISSGNINPSSLNAVNGVIQAIAGQTSNPQYQEFQGQINEFINSLAPILGAGGNVTDYKTALAGQIVNALQSGQSMNQVISYFLQQAQQKIQGLQQGGGAINSNGSTNNTNNTGGNTFGSFFGS